MPRNPSVTRRPVRTPLRSSSALVPTVVPWQKNVLSSGRTPSARSVSIPLRMARDGSSGVAESFAIEIAPVSSSRHTKSENVPPVSTVTRCFPKTILLLRPLITAGTEYALRAFSWSCGRLAESQHHCWRIWLARRPMRERSSIRSNRNCLKQVCEISPAVHGADDLDLMDLTLVSVGVRFKKNEIGPFDQHAHGRPNFRASRPESRKVPKRICLGFDRRIKAFCGCWIVEPDDDIDIEQVPPSLGDSRSPQQSSR